MDKLIPFVLMLMGLGALHLAFGGLFRLRPDRPEFWLFGLGVRTRTGAIKVLVVASLLLFLAYSTYRRGSIRPFLDPHPPELASQLEAEQQQRIQSQKQIAELEAKVATLAQENNNCQQIVSRQGTGLANRSDLAAELRASLNLRHREVTDLRASLTQARSEIESLRRDHDALVQSSDKALENIAQLEAQMDVLKNEKISMTQKLDSFSKASDLEKQRLKEENSRLKALYREQDRRAGLLRQGLVLREANDWALEQEIQRLANLVADQPEVNTPRQTDISRSLQKINQVLREGQSLTKQAKAADTRSPSAPSQDNSSAVPEKKK